MSFLLPIKVMITNKVGPRNQQLIQFRGTLIYPGSFSKCGLVRSYSTGKNKNFELGTEDFGDLVVADFNFDSRDDLAVRCEDSNGGTYYRFYIQGNDQKFKLDSFLTDSMMLVPTYVNKARRTLTTFQHAGARYEGEQTYRLDRQTNKWSLIRHRFLPAL